MIFIRKYSCVFLYSVIVYLVLFTLLVSRLDQISKISELQDNVHVHSNYKRGPAAKRRQTGGHPLSFETEMARRKLSQDVQELWNFLAAQLHLHSGHFIEQLPSTDNVIASLLQYKSVLYEDIELYKTQLEGEASDTTTLLLSILTHVNNHLTRLLDATLNELKKIRNSKRLPAFQLTGDTKMELTFLHRKVRALLRQLALKTCQLSDWSSQSRKLSDKIQEQIHKLQNPRNCLAARKLVCGPCSDLKDCGFACLAHIIGLCLVTAYLSNRTMILDCPGWKYSRRGWEVAFLPVSNCTVEHIRDKNVPGITLYEPVREKTIWAPTRSDTNRAVQSQKQARGLKFYLEVEEELYYLRR